jgi:hypothetical protein
MTALLDRLDQCKQPLEGLDPTQYAHVPRRRKFYEFDNAIGLAVVDRLTGMHPQVNPKFSDVSLEKVLTSQAKSPRLRTGR